MRLLVQPLQQVGQNKYGLAFQLLADPCRFGYGEIGKFTEIVAGNVAVDAAKTAKVIVVQHDRLGITRELDIAFQPAGTCGHSPLKRGERIFRRVLVIAAMGDQSFPNLFTVGAIHTLYIERSSLQRNPASSLIRVRLELKTPQLTLNSSLTLIAPWRSINKSSLKIPPFLKSSGLAAMLARIIQKIPDHSLFDSETPA